jgi:hypothetical protein
MSSEILPKCWNDVVWSLAQCIFDITLGSGFLVITNIICYLFCEEDKGYYFQGSLWCYHGWLYSIRNPKKYLYHLRSNCKEGSVDLMEKQCRGYNHFLMNVENKNVFPFITDINKYVKRKKNDSTFKITFPTQSQLISEKDFLTTDFLSSVLQQSDEFDGMSLDFPNSNSSSISISNSSLNFKSDYSVDLDCNNSHILSEDISSISSSLIEPLNEIESSSFNLRNISSTDSSFHSSSEMKHNDTSKKKKSSL